VFQTKQTNTVDTNLDPRGIYNQSTSWALDEDEERLGRKWLGYGSLNAPYWFVGLEPGGSYDPLFARFWIDSLAAAPLFDPRRDARVETNPYFLSSASLVPTWGPLIETVLGFTGGAEDVLDYQRRRFGQSPPNGEMAIMELSAFAARGIKSPSPHRFTFLAERLTAIRDALTAAQPVFAVFYGTSMHVSFDNVVDGFDTGGFKLLGKTVCALVPHPKARGPRRDWLRFGGELRERIKATVADSALR
jgi:hypothetical protein